MPVIWMFSVKNFSHQNPVKFFIGRRLSYTVNSGHPLGPRWLCIGVGMDFGLGVGWGVGGGGTDFCTAKNLMCLG